MEIRNLITTNINKSFFSAQNNIITGFSYFQSYHPKVLHPDKTMELSTQNICKKNRLNCIYNGTQQLPSQYYSLELNTANYSTKL